MPSQRRMYRLLMSTSYLCLYAGVGSAFVSLNGAYAQTLPSDPPYVTNDGSTVTYSPATGTVLKQTDHGGVIFNSGSNINLVQDGPGITELVSNETRSCSPSYNCVNYQGGATIVKQGTLRIVGNANKYDDKGNEIDLSQTTNGTLPNTSYVEVDSGGNLDVSGSNGWRNTALSSSGVALGGLRGSGTVILGDSAQIDLRPAGGIGGKPFESTFSGTITADHNKYQSSGLIIDNGTFTLDHAPSVAGNLFWVGTTSAQPATLNITNGTQMTVFRDLQAGITTTDKTSGHQPTDGIINVSGPGTKVTINSLLGVASADWFVRGGEYAAGGAAALTDEAKRDLESGLDKVQGTVSITNGAMLSAQLVTLGFAGFGNNFWDGIVAGNGTLTVGGGDSTNKTAQLLVGLKEDKTAQDGYSLLNSSSSNLALWVNSRGNGTVNIDHGGILTTSKVTLGAQEQEGVPNAGAVHGDVNLNEGGLLQVLGQGADASHDAIVNFNNTALGQRGTFSLNGGTLQAIGGDLYASMDLNIQKPSDNLFSTIDTNKHNIVLAGQLTGTGGLKKTSEGTLTFGALATGNAANETYLSGKGQNTYSGGTDIEQGQISGTAGSFGTGTINVQKNAKLDLDQETSVAQDGQTPSDSPKSTNSLSNNLTGQGEFDKRGNGTLYYTGDGSGFSGNANVQAGSMVVYGNLNGASLISIAPKAGLYGSGGSFGSGTVDVQQGAKFDIDQEKQGSDSSLDQQGVSNTLQTVLKGQGDFTKTGNGTLYYTGDGSGFTGNTTVQAGTMVVSGSLTGTPLVSVLQGAVLSGEGGSFGSGRIDVQKGAAFELSQAVPASAASDSASASNTFKAVLTGQGELNKTGNGTAYYNADSAGFSGNANVQAGTMVVQSTLKNTPLITVAQGAGLMGTAGSFGSGTIDLKKDGRLDLNQSVSSNNGGSDSANETNSFKTALTGQGNFNKTGDGALHYTADGSGFTGTANVQSGSLSVDGNLRNAGTINVSQGAGLSGTTNSFGSGVVDIQKNATFDLTPSSSVSGSAANTSQTVLKGEGVFNKTGDGALHYTADGSGFTGTANVQSGSLSVDGNLRNAGTINVSQGAALSGTANSFGSGVVDIQKNATLTVSQGSSTAAAATRASSTSNVATSTLRTALSKKSPSISQNLSLSRLTTRSYLANTSMFVSLLGSNASTEADHTTSTDTIKTTLKGQGAFEKTGSGTLHYAGDASAFTGSATVQDGTMAVDSNLRNAELITVAPNAELSGTGGSFGSGTIDVQQNAKLDIAQDGATDSSVAETSANTLQSTLKGQGEFDKTGDGTLYYTGDGHSFGGNTSVQAGTMVVNNTLGDEKTSLMAVAQGATLSGNGNVGGNTTVSGTLAPGNSDGAHAIGTLRINGNLTMSNGSTFYAEAKDGNADNVLVSGKADLSGAKASFNVLDNRPMQSGNVYNLVEASGGLLSHFGGYQSNVQGAYPYLKPELTYTATNAQVTVADVRASGTNTDGSTSSKPDDNSHNSGTTTGGGTSSKPDDNSHNSGTTTGGGTSSKPDDNSHNSGTTTGGGTSSKPDDNSHNSGTTTGGSTSSKPDDNSHNSGTTTGGSTSSQPDDGNHNGGNHTQNETGSGSNNTGGSGGNNGNNQPTPTPTPTPTPQVPNFHLQAETRNESAAATGLGQMVAATHGGGALGDAIVNLQTPEAHNALNALSGEIHGSTKTAMVNDSFYLRDASINRLDCIDDALRLCPTGGTEQKPGGVDPNRRVTVWGQVYGSRGGNSGSGSNYLSASHLNQNAVGWIMGADTDVHGWRVGGLLAYGRSMFSNGGSSRSSGYANNASLGVYGGTSWGVGGITPTARLTLKMGADYTWNVLQTSRRITIPGFSDHTKSGTLAGTAQAYAETGYRFVVNTGGSALELEPFVRMTYVSYQQGAFREHGGLTALNVRGQQSNLGYSTFGLKAASSFTLGKVAFATHGSLAYRRAFGALRGTARERFNQAGGAGYDMSVIGTPISADTAVVNTGISAHLARDLTVQLDYIGQYGSHLTTSGGTGKVSYRF